MYQVLARRKRDVEAEEVWTGDTLEEAREQARAWLNANGKPGEVVAEIWGVDRHRLRLTLHMDSFGRIEEQPNPGVVWTKNAPAGGWRHAHVLAPARVSTYEWLVVRFPDIVGTVMGQNVAWGLADSSNRQSPAVRSARSFRRSRRASTRAASSRSFGP